MAKIGICDWGIGGLGVYKELREVLHSSVDVVYFSDAGFTPYGKVASGDLYIRWLKVKEFLIEQGVELIVVACNALSTVVKPDEKVITIADSVNRIVTRYRDEPLGVIGGVRTIESGIYDKGYDNHFFQVAQPLSALVEKGILEGEEVEQKIKEIIEPIKEVKKVVLACTHYPVLIPVFRKMYPNIEFIDPVNDLAEDPRLFLYGNNTLTSFTSGDLQEMIASSKKAWGIELNNVELVKL